ncbi:MAG: hypothetical protein U9N84_01765 [Actinomycetota bacterium]|nr:hypothetical protein [Actinomycetota bacterium]
MMFRFAGVVLALVVLTTACGGTDDADAGVASLEASVAETDVVAADADDDAVVDEEQALLEFSACMRDQGVDFGDPTVDADGNVQLNPGGRPGDGIDRDAMRTAFEACGDNLNGITQGFRNTDLTELEDQFLEYSVCMRDNGYDMPDPDFSSIGRPGGEGGEGGGIFGGINPDDPDFQTAQEACQDILAGFGPGGGGLVRGDRG